MKPHTVALLAALVLTACTPHRVEIRQGNYLTAEVVDQLVIGMSRQQVHYLLGTPVVANPFQPDRWDYVYARKRHREQDEYAYVVVFFDGDVVERIEVRDKPDA